MPQNPSTTTLRALAAACVVALGESAPAVVVPNPLLSGRAFLQLDSGTPVRSTARSGGKVSVSFAGQSTGANPITLEGILIGDAWIRCGQSWPTATSTTGREADGKTCETVMRLLDVGSAQSSTHLEAVKVSNQQPFAVRCVWPNAFEVDLFNQHDLPDAPFRTATPKSPN